MPFKSEKIVIANTDNDRRIKLTDLDKEEIVNIRKDEGLSYNQLAALFNVSKRTIYWIVNPEKLERNKELRKERGGWKSYYDKEKNSEAIKKTRKHKQQLFINGEIKLEDESENNNEETS